MPPDISLLKPLLTPATTFTIPSKETFTEDFNNWTDYALITPLAVIKPSDEADVQTVVKFALEHDLRVAVRSGGHSVFSSCDGVVLDMRGWDDVYFDEGDGESIWFRPGALNGKVVDVAGGRGRCVVSGACNSVGLTSLYCGGGLGPLVPKLGMAIDSLISARLVTASGELLTLSADSNPEIFHMLAGAGQTLGVVTHMQIKTYPLNQTVNSSDGTVFFASFTFPPTKAAEVADLLNTAKWDENTAVYMLVMAEGETHTPQFVFSANYFGSDEDAKRALAKLYALKPITKRSERVPYTRMNHHNDGFGKCRGFKRMIGTGLKQVSAEGLKGMVEALENLIAEGAGDLNRSCVIFELLGMDTARRSSVGVYPHRDIDIWCIPTPWYTRPESHASAEKFGRGVRKLMKSEDMSEDMRVFTAFRAGDEKPEEIWGSQETAGKVAEMKASIVAEFNVNVITE
ncbi:FAD-binding domain-containing protein [Choiromyces venosus 120613-1]|uniref:FAD-binding domain-containing protein n=1 Tax=Choiromyces venosus 120613-1 TaxID=1336337 RepID=A0A3N4JRY8_9PEZI|nr:FAD-binding domain-containing protein [Choiromyces venosus 120613-1]